MGCKSQLDHLAARMKAMDLSRTYTAPARPAAPAMPLQDRLALTLEEAAASVGVCTKTFSKWGLPVVKVGGVDRYLPSDVKQYLRDHRVVKPGPIWTPKADRDT